MYNLPLKYVQVFLPHDTASTANFRRVATRGS